MDETRVGRLIRAVLSEVRELPEVASEWEGMGEDERWAFSHDWDLIVMADHLAAVEKRHRAGELSAVQEGAYRRLREELRANLPAIERLGLHRPPVEP